MSSKLAVAVVLAVGLSFTAKAAPAKEGKVVLAADIKWQDLDPKKPGGPQMTILSGDPKKGPVELLLKVPGGGDSGLHSHSADYWGVVVQGTHTHYKDTVADGKAMSPGSYWFQPGKQNHGDTCAAGTDCILLLNVLGKFDLIPAKGAAPAKGAEKPADKPADKPAEPAKK
jgi:hypothetical protein